MCNDKNSIETERLRLRPLRHEDFSDFNEYYSALAARAIIGGYPPADMKGIRAVFEASLSSPYFFGIELKENGKLIGDIHFGDIVDGYLAYVGFALNENYHGRGYASEALRKASDYAFDVCNFGRIRAIVLLSNTDSQKTLEKCGFNKEALIYEGDYGGRVCDIFYYSKSK